MMMGAEGSAEIVRVCVGLVRRLVIVLGNKCNQYLRHLRKGMAFAAKGSTLNESSYNLDNYLE